MKYEVKNDSIDVYELIELEEHSTRNRIALVVVGFCVATLSLAAVFALWTRDLNLLQITAAVVGTPMGFVLGYYFSRKNGEKTSRRKRHD